MTPGFLKTPGLTGKPYQAWSHGLWPPKLVQSNSRDALFVPQSGGSSSDLAWVARRGHPRKLERIPVVTRNHVHVKVEDRLPRSRSAGVDQVDAVGAQPLRRPAGQALSRPDDRRQLVVVDLEQVPRVPPR